MFVGLLDHVTVLIGIAVKCKAEAGIVYQPYFNFNKTGPEVALGRCIWGIIGVGQYVYLICVPFRNMYK